MSAGGRYPEQDNYRPRSRERGERDPHRDRDRENRPKKERGDGRGQRDRDRKRERHSRDQYDDKRDQYSRDQRHNREPPYPTAPPDYSETSFKENQPVHHREERYDETSSVSYGSPRNGLPPEQMDFYEPGPGLLECYQCRYLCTGRGVLQLVEVMLNILVLVCVVTSHMTLSGLSSASSGFGSGSLTLSYMSFPFQGEEMRQVMELDQQFSFMRAPLLYSGLAVSVVLCTLTLAVLVGGARFVHCRWLLLEVLFHALAAGGYLASVGVYLHFALKMNATEICLRRARLYARNGMTWMNCDISGTDGAVAAFGVLLVVFYIASVVLAACQYRVSSKLKG
ncbi:MARVEL domain-containing protein 3 isoform X2 [Polyodon spathula]|uniref:MARVEL domain-containing protein 3 isoform X2 n=1 Tax=Polyodon spathula TaxID=7913 RepID=UPI001B7F322D|nr:MARVEL domain-containing protein 3 isoform X2 [Polyodon spathula]